MGEEIYGVSNEGTQYAYYLGKSVSERIKQYDSIDSWWWLRSHVVWDYGFCHITNSGEYSTEDANFLIGVVPGFCI